LIHIILKDTDHSQVTGTYKPKTCSCIESFRSLRASRQDGHQKPRFRCMYPKKKPTSQPIDVYTSQKRKVEYNKSVTLIQNL